MDYIVPRDQLGDVIAVDPRIIVYVHGSELKKSEGFRVLSEPFLLEEDGTLRVQLDQDSDHEKQRRKEQQEEEARHNVYGTFQHSSSGPCVVRVLINFHHRIGFRGTAVAFRKEVIGDVQAL